MGELHIKINKCFKQSLQLNPLKRLFFFKHRDSIYKYFRYFKSRQNLYCLVTLSTKVPNKKYLYSRFFFKKNLNFLNISNSYK